MNTENLNVFKGYQTQYQEAKFDNLPVIGSVPTWLSGSFISNGPAQFELGKIQFKHWFDGFAMLKKFDFKEGKVSFKNSFLGSQQYVASNQLKRLSKNEFATYAKGLYPDPTNQATEYPSGVGVYDNCNVNITSVAKHFVAMTESNQAIEFDIDNLNTLGPFQFSDTIKNQIDTAHPQWDTATGEIINVAIEMDRTNKYHVYRITPRSTKRDIICTYVSDTLFYMHGFSITPDYVVLFKSPLTMDKSKLILGNVFNETLYWRKNETSFFIVIDRRSGNSYEIETDKFICLHSVNAYQRKNELILDLICHGDGNPYDALYLSVIKSENPHFPAGVLRRYVLDVPAKKCRHATLSSPSYEFPRVNYKAVNGKNYRFAYVSCIEKGNAFPSALEKFDLRAEKTQQWKQKNYYPGEGVFVPKTNSDLEDEGVLLSIAFRSDTACSSLIILDALNMQQLAETPLPFHLPFGLHGNFYHCKA